jgi:hypothetical protein
MCAMVCISLQLAEKPLAAGVLDYQEARAGGTAPKVPGAHDPAEIALHATGTSRPSKACLRIACRNLPQRARLAVTVDST